MRDATALDRAGGPVFFEGIPREVADLITIEAAAPTIGIGADPVATGRYWCFMTF
jgi:ketopantoate hydroxymethyltransferase